MKEVLESEEKQQKRPVVKKIKVDKAVEEILMDARPQVKGVGFDINKDLKITYGMLVVPAQEIEYLDTVYDMPASRNAKPKSREEYVKSEFKVGMVAQVGIECGPLGVQVGDIIVYKRRAITAFDFCKDVEWVPTHAYVGKISKNGGCVDCNHCGECKQTERVSIVEHIAGWFTRNRA